MSEIWKPVVGFESRYLISDQGRLFSIKSGRLRKPKLTKDGYEVFALCKNGKSKHIAAHRLVAIAFIENPLGLPCVNHKDENKRNNSVSNLEWITIKDNDNYGTRNKRMSATKKKPVTQYDLNMNIVQIHTGVKDAMRSTGVNKNSIINACRGCRESAGGYIWRYKEEKH